MRRTIGGIPLFAVMILILLGLLQLANWVPSAVQEGALQRYGSIEEVRKKLTTATIYAPAYFPRSVHWPPTLIAAQNRPYIAVLSEYRGNADRSTILCITQPESGRPPLRDRFLLQTVRERVPYPFKGRTALLEAGLCRTGERCSRIAWEENGFTLALELKDAPVDLVRIAESMIEGPGPDDVHHSVPRAAAGDPREQDR